MAKKLSKKDTTPEMEEASKAAQERLESQKSEHFAVDSFVMLNNRRGRVVANNGKGSLLVEWDDAPNVYDAVRSFGG